MTKTEYTKFVKGIVHATRGLLRRTPDDKLDWRPDPSFMKLSAVACHVSDAVGTLLRDVMNDKWEYAPQGAGGEAGLPPADAFPAVKSVTEAIQRIDADWKLFEERFAGVDEKTFNSQVCKIPWMAPGTTLKEYMLLAAEHLCNHRMQLFMYLRLLGVKIGTAELYGG